MESDKEETSPPPPSLPLPTPSHPHSIEGNGDVSKRVLLVPDSILALLFYLSILSQSVFIIRQSIRFNAIAENNS